MYCVVGDYLCCGLFGVIEDLFCVVDCYVFVMCLGGVVWVYYEQLVVVGVGVCYYYWCVGEFGGFLEMVDVGIVGVVEYVQVGGQVVQCGMFYYQVVVGGFIGWYGVVVGVVDDCFDCC